MARAFNEPYEAEHLSRVAFPLGGIGAGMVCLEGTGALSHVSLRHEPEVFNEPLVFAALCLRGESNVARVLEGPVPAWKATFPWGSGTGGASGNGGPGKSYGLPRFPDARFEARFPFATVTLSDARLPVAATITGWSPFTPGDADSSSLPAAALEYRFANRSDAPVDAVFSFHARNFMSVKDVPGDCVERVADGFVLRQRGSDESPGAEGAFAATTDAPGARADCRWFRGGWWDPLTILWRTISGGEAPDNLPYDDAPSPGGSLYVPLALPAGGEATVRVRLAWYVPKSGLRLGPDPPEGEERTTHVPWYAGRFGSVEDVSGHWSAQYEDLRRRSAAFRDCFYDTTLPPEVVEAVAANLTILKSPTVLRQRDGRLWAWEGCCDDHGCCHGSCTHVWNYAQALAHLFPDLERSLRQTEFHESQDVRGHQAFRSALPVRPADHGGHAASDGQLGGILKVYREWRVSGDTGWMASMWPQVKQSLAYCIETWDPDRRGVLVEPHHNTYDIEFWGPDGMCSSFYLGALKAAAAMAREAGDDPSSYEDLYARGRRFVETDLYDGEYFVQKIEWEGLRAPNPASAGADLPSEARALLEKEGPKYQYGTGCLSDGVLGAWLAVMCGVDEVLDPAKVTSHLRAVYRYNLRRDLSEHANPQRPTFAFGSEGGLLLCSWPKGGALSLPFVYSDEVWTGIEYQVASHLIVMGCVEEGLDIVRICRARYDGRVRNPFNEYECGHWYARAMASYGLLQSLGGARYDAVEKTLYLRPAIEGDVRAFLCTATGYGTVGVKAGRPFLEVREGVIDAQRIVKE